MFHLISTTLIVMAFGGEPLDGYDRIQIVASAKQTALLWRDASNEERRQEVAKAAISDHLIVGRDRPWFREVLEWACRPYDRPARPDVDPMPIAPTPYLPQAVQFYYVPQAYYYQPLIRGGCATGNCPR